MKPIDGLLIEAGQNIEMAQEFLKKKNLKIAINPRQDIKMAIKFLERAQAGLQLCRATAKTKQ